jgi:NAD(P)-dependent dehydrogenase (short-subunit alcohol dehydrogenase family)
MALDPSSIRLDGRVAVVTGGGAGIGRGIARGLAAFGARVAIWERDADACAAAADEVGGLACPADVRLEDDVDVALAATVESLGTPTILVNNAGGVFWTSLLDAPGKAWDTLIRSNLTHLLLCTQRVARAMVAAGLPGAVVNVTSIEGTRAAPGYAAYAAAKAGVVSLTKTAALELAPHGIRVNCLAPDVTLTDGLLAVAHPGFERSIENMVPMGRAGTVDEMAGAAVFLASEMSSYITGETIHIDGGTAAAGGWYHHPDDGRYVLGAPDPTSS